MNYIKQLQAENAALKAAATRADGEVTSFLAHLHSNKFAGVAADGSRKDWIATADVIHRLVDIRRMLTP